MTAPARITQADMERATKAVASAHIERARIIMDLAKGRTETSATNQRLGSVQPSALTNASPPSPARVLSNLLSAVPCLGTEPSASMEKLT